nr:hypothetical protein [Ktedonobacterales bacterium]
MKGAAPLHVLVAPQAFKGSLAATQVAAAIATGYYALGISAIIVAVDGPRPLTEAM